MTDPIADMLTRIRNAQSSGHEKVRVPFSHFKLNLAKILKNEGYIKEVDEIKEQGKKFLEIVLKYQASSGVIRGLRRISKPGQRSYVGHRRIPRVLQGYGVAIISTSKGLLTDKEARKLGIGGEIICEVW